MNNIAETSSSIFDTTRPVQISLILTQRKFYRLASSTSVLTSFVNLRVTFSRSAAISMSMANISGHLMSTMNPAHLSDGVGGYFVTAMPNDLGSGYKLPPSSNSDLPSPSTSSNSSNPPSSNHHHHGQHSNKRHGEGDTTRKREVRLQKNREAARECRRKKKEYIKCLEERVTGLENQNKALIEELRQLKELYCQRDDTKNVIPSKTNGSSTSSASTSAATR